MGLIVRSSFIHAAGCYTTTDIPKGTRIVEYTGPRITKDEGDDRYEGRDETYLFGLGDGEVVIDGHGIASFINHSCDPNCEPDDVGDRMYIFALRDIKAGEELTYEYNLYDGGEDDPAPCYCGAKNCRGTMYSDEEVNRLKTATVALEAGAGPVAPGAATPVSGNAEDGTKANSFGSSGNSGGAAGTGPVHAQASGQTNGKPLPPAGNASPKKKPSARPR